MLLLVLLLLLDLLRRNSNTSLYTSTAPPFQITNSPSTRNSSPTFLNTPSADCMTDLTISATASLPTPNALFSSATNNRHIGSAANNPGNKQENDSLKSSLRALVSNHSVGSLSSLSHSSSLIESPSRCPSPLPCSETEESCHQDGISLTALQLEQRLMSEMYHITAEVGFERECVSGRVRELILDLESHSVPDVSTGRGNVVTPANANRLSNSFSSGAVFCIALPATSTSISPR